MFEYGIAQSKADYWCHVVPLDLCIYIYKQKFMLEHMMLFPVTKIKTAIGHLVSCNGLPVFSAAWCFSDMPVKTGSDGEQILAKAIRAGVLWWAPEIPLYADLKLQLKGIDFVLRSGITIECKLDRPGGAKGTNNLFVQTHERRLYERSR